MSHLSPRERYPHVPHDTVLSVPASAVQATLSLLHRTGSREAGVFWYGPRDATGRGLVQAVIAASQTMSRGQLSRLVGGHEHHGGHAVRGEMEAACPDPQPRDLRARECRLGSRCSIRLGHYPFLENGPRGADSCPSRPNLRPALSFSLTPQQPVRPGGVTSKLREPQRVKSCLSLT